MSHVRNGFATVRPYVYGPHSILKFVEHALSGEQLAGHKGPDNAVHSEVKLGDSVIVLELRDPPHPSGFPGSIYVYVPDVDLVVARAGDCEVEVFAAPEDKPYDERQAGIRDAYGNVWWISTYLGG